MKRYIKSANALKEKHDMLPGSIIYDRLIDLCNWTEDSAWGIVEDNEEYTLSRLIDILHVFR